MNCYLDWASTTPILPESLNRYREVSENLFGNPSSQHSFGTEAKKVLEEQRETCANLLGVKSRQLLFTSGGSEGNMLILTSFLRKKRKGKIIFSGIEHPSVHEYGMLFTEFGFSVDYLRAEGGFIDPQRLYETITEETLLVSVMTVNNVTGAIQPIEEIAAAVRRREKEYGRTIHLHTDAVQALGKIPLNLIGSGVDSASFSAHKFQGPRGIGMLYAKKDPRPLSLGGGQEFDLRAGTENLPAIAAMSSSLQSCLQDLPLHAGSMKSLTDALFSHIQHRTDLYTILGTASREKFSPAILSFSCRNIPAEITTRVMNDHGFAISAGSACSSRDRKKRERVLKYMGFPAAMRSSVIRVSVGPVTTAEVIDECMKTLDREVGLLHKILGKR